MYPLLQLLLAVIAIYGVLNFQGEMRLYVPLACLVSMFIGGRLDKERFDKKEARKNYLRSEMERVAKKDTIGTKEQDLFHTNALLWPKGELVLVDAVHFVFKDLGFKVAPTDRYGSVDRIVRIPDTHLCFGVEILMSDEGVEKNHPKIKRALHFEKEKEANEKTLIIASTHIRQPLSERERLNEISMELHKFLAGGQVSLITAYTLYQLWQKSKAGEIDILDVFRKFYSHPCGIFSLGETHPSTLVSLGA